MTRPPIDPVSPPLLRVQVEQRLGEPLHEYLIARRANGLSWGRIAARIHNATGLYVSTETVRQWHLAGAPKIGGTS